MTHETARERLLELVYGELTPAEAREAEAHLAGCAECRADRDRLEGTRRTMARLPLEPAPASGEAALLAAAREAARARRPARARRLVPRWAWGGAVGLAAAAMIVAVSYRLLDLKPRGEPDADALRGSGYDAPAAAPAEARRAVEPNAVGPGPATPAPARPPPPLRRAPAPAAAPSAREETETEKADAALEPRADAAPSPEPKHVAALRAAPSEAAESGAPPAAPAPSAGERKATQATRAPVARQPQPATAPAFPPSVERRTFADCPGERVRELERDDRGRVIRWAREGEVEGRAVRVEVRYGPDGALTGIAVTPRPAAAPDAAALGVPLRAQDASLETPPRCGR